MNTTLLPGFESRRVDVDGVTVNCAIAGSGPPVLMLHGYPENHLMWRHVAPAIAQDHTVVLADLRGYGDSGKPAPDAAGEVYSKRSMARDQLGLMRELGFGQFQLVGHDRGARVSHRLTLDHPGAVTRLAVLDIVPTRHVYGHVTREMATAYYHWFFLPLRHGIPEHMIGADPGFWINSIVGPLLGQRREHRPGRARRLHPLLQRPGDDRRLVRRLPLGREPRPRPRRRDLRRRPAGRVPGPGAVGHPGLRRPRLRTRSACGASTPPTSAARPCPPATSSPRKPPTW